MQEDDYAHLPPLGMVEDRKFARFVVVEPSWDIGYLSANLKAEIQGLTEDGDSIQLPVWLKRYWKQRQIADTVVWLLNILAVGKSRQELEAMGAGDVP